MVFNMEHHGPMLEGLRVFVFAHLFSWLVLIDNSSTHLISPETAKF